MIDSIMSNIWREIALKPELTISLPKIWEHLKPGFQPKLIVLRKLSLTADQVQTIASYPATKKEFKPSSTKNPEAILNWFFSDELLLGNTEQISSGLAELIPPQVQGFFLAGPLIYANKPVGVCIWQLPDTTEQLAEAKQLFRHLQEPFAAAIVNHHQIHELRNLREKVEAENRFLLSRLDRQDISESIIGAENGLKDVCERIELVRGADVPVLLLGETGSGKEVVARALHSRSKRINAPFLRVNCCAIPPELIDSHLFGHERGSFSGAESLRKGWFERADGGTLFLDEIGDLPLQAQVRLLRVLQDGSFERVGGQNSLTVDVRIIAATHCDLRAMVKRGQFREDLWYRIAVFPIAIPPLRERQEDIPLLATHFALRAAKRLDTMPLNPSQEDNRLLMSYSWPGNVRELSAVMERAVILGNGRALEVGAALGLGTPIIASSSQTNITNVPEGTTITSLNNALVQHIERTLSITEGKVEGKNGAARLLKINPHTLRAKMRKLGINWKRFRSD